MSAHTGDRLFPGAPARLAAEHYDELRTTTTVARLEDATARVQHPLVPEAASAIDKHLDEARLINCLSHPVVGIL
jgi:hypothetical protein